jgi:hypothetical protein
MILAQALSEYGLAAMMSALRSTLATVEFQLRQDPTPFYVVGALAVLIWFLFLKKT